MRIIKVKYLHDFKIELLFSNGEIKTADFEIFLKNSQNRSIKIFLDQNKFKKVELDTGFLSWNNGEMEISAISVYDKFLIKEAEKV